MSVLREGIEDVRALALPDGIAADGRGVAVSQAALVTWRSCLKAMLHQVYVNGTFAGRTADCEERQLVVPTPASFESAVRIEVVAVSPRDANRDFGGELAARPAGGRVKLKLLRSQSLSAEAAMNVYCDGGSGTIDYAEPLNKSPMRVWARRQDKAGFGMSRFGSGDFGYESAAAAGFGNGCFGNGLFGQDADVVEWISPVLPPGRYRFAVRIVDASGLEGSPAETDPIAVVPAAQPASYLGILEFDAYANQLTLGISDKQLT